MLTAQTHDYVPQAAIVGLDITAGDANAISLGYTRRVHIEGGMEESDFLVKPSTDLDGKFVAWAIDWQEWNEVHGSNVLIEEVEV